MRRETLRPLEPRRPDAGYASQGELLADLAAWADLLLYLDYNRHQWLGPNSDLKNMLGLVVSREEFEHNLEKAAQRGLWIQLTPGEQGELDGVRIAIEARIKRTTARLPLLELFERFHLDPFERDCVVLAYLPETDRKYEKLYAYLQDDVTRRRPDTALAAQLLLPPGEELETYLARFSGRGGFLQLFSRERLELFRGALKGVPLDGDCSLEELAAKFRFTPRQICAACDQAAGLAGLEGETAVTRRLLHRCCHRQAVHRLGELASRVPAAYSWDDVVLPGEQKRLMQQACGHIQYQHQVYYGWGFDRKVRYGRGMSILFAGAPGTGKTMCAQVIANQLDMELYKINLSQIVSKYIGETEKNLRAVFQEARHAGCILFFDECDALFGKRSEVKDAHDRNANVEVAYLLQQQEEHDGVCILATNLIGNIDAAFMRRITYVVRFPFPEPPMREAIYRRMVPDGAPLADDIDWSFLAEKFQLSGGHIKNIVLAAAFLAAGAGEPISMGHLLRAAVDELKKNDIVVVREELQEYADLLEH